MKTKTKYLLFTLFTTALIFTGCSTPTGNFLGHALVPGYSTIHTTGDRADVLQEEAVAEQHLQYRLAQKVSAFSADPTVDDDGAIFKINVTELPGYWDATKQAWGEQPLVETGKLGWDLTKGYALARGIEEINDRQDNDNSEKPKQQRELPQAEPPPPTNGEGIYSTVESSGSGDVTTTITINH